MVDVFENAVSISIHDKDVRSIKTLDGIVVWEKPVQTTTILVFSGDAVSFGQNLVSTGDVTVDWGDGTTEIINNPTTNISHIYSDGETTHTVILDGEITSFGYKCFENCSIEHIDIPNTVTSFGDWCFSHSTFESFIIPDVVVNIGNGCFSNCTNLTSIHIPNTITRIPPYCFMGCSNLHDITIPDSVTSIRVNVFSSCHNLEYINIPNSVEELGGNCFYKCNSLNDYDLNWQSNVVTCGENLFSINEGTVFHIPQGTTQLYINANYPSDRLVERSE